MQFRIGFADGPTVPEIEKFQKSDGSTGSKRERFPKI
jgi:hypothetical protein